MYGERLEQEALTEKSKELAVPFSILLGAAVLEEVIWRIGSSQYGERLWLRNKDILGIEQYKRKLFLCPRYCCVIDSSDKVNGELTDGEILSDLAEGLRWGIFAETEECGILFSQREKIQKNCLQIWLSADVSAMQIPVFLKIQLIREDGLVPAKESFPCIIYPQHMLSCYCYPVEMALAEKFMEAVTKLELIPDIGVYYEIYEILMHESIDGRKVRDYIEGLCEKRGMPKKKTGMDFIKGYRNYSYMKKRWKTFLRSVPCREPSWQEAVECFLNFFDPIWQTVLEDTIFFGDWMPELNRFL